MNLAISFQRFDCDFDELVDGDKVNHLNVVVLVAPPAVCIIVASQLILNIPCRVLHMGIQPVCCQKRIHHLPQENVHLGD